MRVERHLRVARGAAGEEEDRRIVAARGILAALEDVGERRVFGVEAAPALAAAVDEQADGGEALGHLRFRGGLAVRGADDRLYVAGGEAVGEVVGRELAGRGDDDGADLVAGEDRRPELVVALHDEHHLVPLPDAE